MLIRAKPPNYCSYLLRCWKERGHRPGHTTAWRFSLEDTRSGDRHAFADLPALVAFLAGEVMDEATVVQAHADGG